MPLLGLIDWIIIALAFLVVEFTFICLFLFLLSSLFAFRPKEYWRPSTHYINDREEPLEHMKHKFIEAPRNYFMVKFEREEKMKWYNKLILGY